MFFSKLKDKVSSISLRVSALENDKALVISTVDCEVCGCMVKKLIAVRGKGVIKQIEPSYEFGLPTLGYILSFMNMESEYLHTPYYCKRCAPKAEKGK